MSLKNKFFSVITLSVAVVAYSTFASAQDSTTTNSSDSVERQEKRERKGLGKRGEHGKGMRGGRHGGIMRGVRGLDLTDAQKEQLRVIHENNKPNEAVRQELQAIRQAKRDGGTITAEQKDRLKALRLQSREKAAQIHQQVLAILTSEQRQQLETRKEQMRKKREERRQLRRDNKQNTNKTTDN
ncbi:MAG: Spy/CpxP family protein refolding chaperone [Acidobacteriota bacterium]|nr:Spy/CpxP family protein refolding chaperone [Blastocatellia bacterium]MDQ3221112.1 Spy/CpxP family protein refolding chaperone [Acidobacteriota bacterium]MDQ3490573.1 Spy/CpxP family protein refolding chaperone [Acidobacteriota bacterium]